VRTKTTHSYIARRSCGCIVNAIIDNPDTVRETALEVAAWERRGLTTERVLHSVVASEFVGFFCPHNVRATTALDVAKRETTQQYAESQMSLIGEPI